MAGYQRGADFTEGIADRQAGVADNSQSQANRGQGRHSAPTQPAGRSVARYCDRQRRRVQMKITDNGVVRTPWTAGVGLSSMRERAAALGGWISAGPGASGGEVRVTLPLAVS